MEPVKTHILVVDDNQSLGRLLEATLSRAGYAVSVATSGAALDELLPRITPDLVLLDVELGDTSGYHICTKLRAEPRTQNTPVIMMTGSGEDNAIDAAYEVGATDFIAKPFQVALLRHRIKYLLRAAAAFHDVEHSRLRLLESQRLARIVQWEYSPHSDILHWAPGVNEVLGVTEPKDKSGLGLSEFLKLIHPRDRARVQGLVRGGQAHQCDYRVQTPDGRRLEVHQEAALTAAPNGEALLLGTVQDLTDRRRVEKVVDALTYFDSNTRLPNRVYFMQYMKAIVQSYLQDDEFVVFSVEIDGFEQVNETFGYRAGECCLRTVAERLTAFSQNKGIGIQSAKAASTSFQPPRVAELPASVSPPDSTPRSRGELLETWFVAHLGSAEFGIALAPSGAEPQQVAESIIEVISWPIPVGVGDVRVNAKVGITQIKAQSTPDSLIEEARAARLHARRNSSSPIEFFSEQIHERLRARVKQENALRFVLGQHYFPDGEHTAEVPSSGKLELHFQPKFCSSGRRILGTEALLRGTVDGQRVSPMDLVEVAEGAGLIAPLGEWVLRTACLSARRLPGLHVAVNVSPNHFLETGFADMVMQTLSDTGLSGALLELEITEGVLIQDAVRCKAVMLELQASGVSFALDDFGTGYSSLSYLTQFPVNKLKLDKSFVQTVDTERGRTIVQAIIEMSNSLGITTVVEGVETKQQCEWFCQLGTLELQGYYLSRPIPLADVEALLVGQSRYGEGNARLVGT
jgi:EAL domain-containing protein (putative c-di-GMP-specific phosphodiesterase class I)/DNA-binding response OmpR family regulator/GGDEF domain-containing protein